MLDAGIDLLTLGIHARLLWRLWLASLGTSLRLLARLTSLRLLTLLPLLPRLALLPLLTLLALLALLTLLGLAVGLLRLFAARQLFHLPLQLLCFATQHFLLPALLRSELIALSLLCQFLLPARQLL